MACSIGPIHQWIFEQARRAERRGERLAAALGPDVQAAWTTACAQHPVAPRAWTLPELIGEGAVHEGLEAYVASVSAREAALYRAARAAGPAALAEFAAALRADARELALAAGRPGDARAAFASLREHWLEGMPCHVEIELIEDEPGAVAWRRRGQPLATYWGLEAEAAAALGALHVEWMAAFVAASGDLRLSAAPWPEGGEGSLALRLAAGD